MHIEVKVQVQKVYQTLNKLVWIKFELAQFDNYEKLFFSILI